jgi:hypothetical protein
MMMPKKDPPSTSASSSKIHDQEFEDALNESKFDDPFDKMTSDKPNEETIAEKNDETKTDSKSITVEDLPTIKEVSIELPKINEDIVKYFKESQYNFRQAIEGIKSLK